MSYRPRKRAPDWAPRKNHLQRRSVHFQQPHRSAHVHSCPTILAGAVPTTMDDVTVRLLKSELASWDRFIDALRADDKEVARTMIDRCMKVRRGHRAVGKEYLDQALLPQHPARPGEAD